MGMVVNFFFSGFVLGKVPFALSPRFKLMLQVRCACVCVRARLRARLLMDAAPCAWPHIDQLLPQAQSTHLKSMLSSGPRNTYCAG